MSNRKKNGLTVSGLIESLRVFCFQVICDADLMFIDCIVKWPGSVHDARILRESDMFDAFESNQGRPVRGLILGDSGYMLRDWLFTPFLNPNTAKERAYNLHQKSARSTVERAIGILKRRWHCLRRLRLRPVKACKVITVCIILHNQARSLNLEVPSDSDSDSDSDADSDGGSNDDHRPANYQHSERIRVNAGKAARQRLVDNFF